MSFLTIGAVNKNIKSKITLSTYSESWYFDIFYVLPNYLSLKVKGSVLISHKHGIYKFWNGLRLRVLGI